MLEAVHVHWSQSNLMFGRACVLSDFVTIAHAFIHIYLTGVWLSEYLTVS